MKRVIAAMGLISFLGAAGISYAVPLNSEVNGYMQNLEKQARQEDPSFKGFSAERGRKIFFTEEPHKELGKISCATCHTSDLKRQGKNEKTGKSIEPLAPSVNKKSITNVKNIEKWLKRNFRDVYAREGNTREKGDVLMFISTQ